MSSAQHDLGPAWRLRLDATLARLALALPERVQRTLVRRPVVLDGQELSVELQLLLRLQEVAREPKIEDLPLQEARAATVRQARLVGGRQSVGAIRELTVEGAEGPLRARLYIPSSRIGADRIPTLMFIHGGGWVYGDLDSHDAACRRLAELSGVQLLAVDYRLAPEHPFPAAVEDCWAAYRWMVDHLAELHGDPERLGVGGDSAGGNLSAVTALWAAENGLPLHFQLLIYPATDQAHPTASRRMFGEGFFLSERFMTQATGWYTPDPAEREDPRCSPLLREEFPAGLAPALVLTAGFDPLRDEGEAYADLLRRNGVEVELVRYRSMIHGFFNMVGSGHDAVANHDDIAARLRRALGQDPAGPSAG